MFSRQSQPRRQLVKAFFECLDPLFAPLQQVNLDMNFVNVLHFVNFCLHPLNLRHLLVISHSQLRKLNCQVLHLARHFVILVDSCVPLVRPQSQNLFHFTQVESDGFLVEEKRIKVVSLNKSSLLKQPKIKTVHLEFEVQEKLPQLSLRSNQLVTFLIHCDFVESNCARN